MNLLLRSNSWCGCTRVSRALCYSTKTIASSFDSNDSLYRRIIPPADPRVSIVPVLDQWLEDGKDVKKGELQKLIRQLRKFRRFTHALQISEWMNDQMNREPSPGDFAVQLDLISKVHGIEQAEKYFNSIPENLRGFQVYGALLNSYAHNRSLEKSEATMQKMRKMGFEKTSLSYNVMLNLYSRMRKFEKLDVLMQEMEERGISCDIVTFTIRLNAYIAASDVEGMEKLLMKMEADPLADMDWNAYVIAANGYMKAGLTKKALTMLKRSEQLITPNTMRPAYETLLTLYTSLGDKDEVSRILSLYNRGKVYNSGYTCIITSLVKLGDIDSAERILEEWKSRMTFFDIRVPNALISACCKKGLLDKAEAIINRLTESGKELNSSTWGCLATGYHEDGQMEKAVETMKKAILATPSGRKPNRHTLAACLDYLKGKEDMEVAAELLRLLREKGYLSIVIYDRLVDYIYNGNPDSTALDQIEGEDQVLDGEMHNFRELE